MCKGSEVNQTNKTDFKEFILGGDVDIIML